jgi:hypothetical protein
VRLGRNNVYLINLNQNKMIEELRLREETLAEMPQCLEPCESEEQLAERRKLDLLKRWEIGILPLDRGCIVKVGCKSIAFTSIEAAYKEIGRYLENPRLVATQHGFGEHL